MTYNYNKYSYHYKTLLSLGTPLVVGQVGTIVLGFADTLMVGHHSVTELAAASFVNTIMAIILVFALGYSYGLTPIIGRLYGQGNTEKNSAVVKHGLLAAATTSVILLAVLYLVYMNIHRMGQPEELLPLMRPYMIVNMISLPFACWFNTFKQFFDGIGHTKTSMYIMIAGNILNIGGNYLLIYGPGPMPELGLLGAGISTMASRIIMFFAAAAIFLFTKKYKIYSSAMRNSRFSKELYRTIDKQSWPVALQMGMESSAFALTGVMAGWLGTTALATHQIMITISQLFFMVYYGITSAVSVRVSYYIGQNDVKQLRDVAAAGLHIVLLIGAIVVIPVLLLRNDMGYWFADSKEVAEMCDYTDGDIPVRRRHADDLRQCSSRHWICKADDVHRLRILFHHLSANELLPWHIHELRHSRHLDGISYMSDGCRRTILLLLQEKSKQSDYLSHSRSLVRSTCVFYNILQTS